MIIDDGAGTGYKAQVNARNELKTEAVIQTEEHAKNEIGKVWSLVQSTTPVAANDYIFYLKNTGSELLHITRVQASAASACTLYIQHVTGTPAFTAGVDLTPVSMNLGYSNTISATIKEDTNTTGLTSKGVLRFIECPVANTSYIDIVDGNIIIPQGQSIAMYTDGTGAVETLWTIEGDF